VAAYRRSPHVFGETGGLGKNPSPKGLVCRQIRGAEKYGQIGEYALLSFVHSTQRPAPYGGATISKPYLQDQTPYRSPGVRHKAFNA
jgi:hypothetical protein